MSEAHRADLLHRIRALARPLAPLETDAAPRLAPLGTIRAVLFDVYGTLLVSGSGDVGTAAAADSEAALDAALAAVGVARGRAAPTALTAAIRAEHARRRAGGVAHPEVEIRTIWRQVLEPPPAGAAAGGRLTPDEIECLAVEYECRVNPTWLMPGALSTLATLADRGVILGIVSNAQFYTPLVLEALAGSPVEALGFCPTLCSWSYACGEAKPSTRVFERALAALQTRTGIRPEETAYVGNDCLNDIWAAREAGCRTVLFAGDRRSLRWRDGDARCAGLQPDAVITRLAQLPGVIGRGGSASAQSSG